MEEYNVAINKEQRVDTHNIFLQRIVLSEKKINPKGNIIYDSIYIPLWNDEIIEIEHRLMADRSSGADGEGRRRCGYKKGNGMDTCGDGNVCMSTAPRSLTVLAVILY